MRQGIFTPNRPAISALTKLLIFLIFVYTPRGLMEKAVASELIDRWFKSWSGQDFFFLFFIINQQFQKYRKACNASFMKFLEFFFLEKFFGTFFLGKFFSQKFFCKFFFLVNFFENKSSLYLQKVPTYYLKKKLSQAGIEPGSFCSTFHRLIHYATR